MLESSSFFPWLKKQKKRPKRTEANEVLRSRSMKLTVELEQEEDGRYIAEVLELPGVMVYGDTPAQALAKVQVLALRVLADKLEGGEFPETPLTVSFETASAA